MSAREVRAFDIGLHKCGNTGFVLREGFTITAFEADPALVPSPRVMSRLLGRPLPGRHDTHARFGTG